MVLMPCSKCCGKWRCFTDGSDYACVGPNETPPAGWTTDGTEHSTELDCLANCGVIQCYKSKAERRYYNCFSSLELTDEEAKFWSLYKPDVYLDKQTCKEQCGPTGMCCLPDGTCKNRTTLNQCTELGGVWFQGYVDPNCDNFGFSQLCGQTLCDDIICTEDGQPAKCVEYTINIKATAVPPVDPNRINDGVMSFVEGTPTNKPYPIGQNLTPFPFGPKIDSIWPEKSFNWESGITLSPEEEGELVVDLQISKLMSLTSHWNAQQPDNQLAPTPDAPEYVGDFSCETETVIPIRVYGCNTECIGVWLGNSDIATCDLPGDAERFTTRYVDEDCQYPGCPTEEVWEAGGEVELGRSYLSVAAGSGFPCLGNCSPDVPKTCYSCSATYTKKVLMDYAFSAGIGGALTPAFAYWPAGEPNPNGFKLGTAYEITQQQEWEISISINEVPCGKKKQRQTEKQDGQFMSLRNKVVGGPGTHLKKMLEAWGIKSKEKGCGCRSMEKKMNRLGSTCKEPANLKMIVDHLQAEAKKRKLPFVRKAGELLVLRAVKKFEKES